MANRAEVKILPPFVLLSVLGMQGLLWALVPTRFPGNVALPLGLLVITGSIVVALLAAREIIRAKTALDVRKETTALVATGVFEFSRNPVYLSMVLLVIGVGLTLNSPWSLLLAIPTGSALCLTAIKPEERYLEAKFGEAYRAYRQAVPRWFSVSRAFSAL
jgi:protein-S-isoprenylcysteine O-methyltransferase Ste14